MASMGRRFVVSLYMGVIAGTCAASLGAQSLNPVVAPSAKCEAAKRKLGFGEKSLGRMVATIDRYTAARASCARPEVCRRYQTKIKALEDRKVRSEARVEKLKAGAVAACEAH